MEALEAAMEAVKEKILREDYIGATYAVMDARNALPNHPDLSHLAVLCDVLRAKDIALPGRGIDWTWILRLLPSASPSDVESQHRLLSSEIAALGPSFPSAAKALALLDEARSVLLDQVTETARPRWTAKDFVPDEIWAVSGASRFPRHYVKVKWMVSESEVSVSLLEPEPEPEQDEENLPSVCGVFKPSDVVMCVDIARFSHRMNCDRNKLESLYRIHPNKGEVWAIYAGWNRNWKRGEEGNCEYWVVEIVSEFREKRGIVVSRLVRVDGCETFFQREMYDGFQMVMCVCEAEILRFSHQIPAFTVPGIERHGILRGSLHLCPDALPPKPTWA
ncbi:hypothetical protein QJS10_CPB17g02138 [Acorus calamus]|uniref:DUF3444 domain-containing protein n=1 Tax=Acorus calamus TaxID=4465 RepID=A0AAV9CV69_ACOCL|nr:hypothetical protein QJS10_CPB17g02138 [Acorus calamus]